MGDRNDNRAPSSRDKRALALIPFGFILAVTLFDLLSGTSFHYGLLLVLAPMIAALVGGPWLTASAGLVAVCAQTYLGAHLHVLHIQRGEAFQIIFTTVLSTVVVLLSRAREDHRRKLQQIRSVSQAAQRALMRPLPNRLGTLQIASFYLAAADESEIGGDLYTATQVGDTTRMVIGDVRGKGLNAVGESALLIGAFREAAGSHPALGELAAALDRSVSRYLADFVDDYAHAAEHFITALLLDIPSGATSVQIANCGHPPPLLVHKGEVRVLDSSDPLPPLGMHLLAPSEYSADTTAFDTGDTLLLYTDGVIEARNPDGEFYPLLERIGGWTELAPDALVQRLERDLLAHAGGRLGDDAAAIAVKRPRLEAPTPGQGLAK